MPVQAVCDGPSAATTTEISADALRRNPTHVVLEEFVLILAHSDCTARVRRGDLIALGPSASTDYSEVIRVDRKRHRCGRAPLDVIEESCAKILLPEVRNG